LQGQHPAQESKCQQELENVSLEIQGGPFAIHIVGCCVFGNQCRHSHDKLPDNVCEEIDKWIKECKEKAAKKDNKKNGGQS
jgi:hypothetical protein